MFINKFNLKRSINDIEKIRKLVDHLIVYIHWGGEVEGGWFPDNDQPKIARKFIDSGASLVVGHHSHTLQPFEVYKDKYIFYSLGNFCFTDFWFEDKYYPLRDGSRKSMVLNVDFKKSFYNVDIKLFNNHETHFSLSSEKLLINRNKIWKYFFKFEIITDIYILYMRYVFPTYSFLKRNDIGFIEKLNRIIKSLIRKIK